MCYHLFTRFLIPVVFSKGIGLMRVADLTVDELRALIREVVHEQLRDLLADPDKGLELTDEIRTRLQFSLTASDRIPFEEVRNRLDLA